MLAEFGQGGGVREMRREEKRGFMRGFAAMMQAAAERRGVDPFPAGLQAVRQGKKRRAAHECWRDTGRSLAWNAHSFLAEERRAAGANWILRLKGLRKPLYCASACA